MTYDTITDKIKEAMKQNDTLVRDCLRGVVSEIKNQTVNAGKEITEDICINVLRKCAKQRKDSILSFEAGNRNDLAEKEKKELELIEQFLPQMLTEEQIQTRVLKLIADNHIEETKKNMGVIMKALNQLPEKNLIDKKYVSQYLNTLLK